MDPGACASRLMLTFASRVSVTLRPERLNQSFPQFVDGYCELRLVGDQIGHGSAVSVGGGGGFRSLFGLRRGWRLVRRAGGRIDVWLG